MSAGTLRPGGRTARVREAVREATLAELGEKGFEGLTVESVARRSGVHKTTVYRRWGSVEGLAADALDLAGGEPWPVPDTGTVEGDLRELTRLVLTGFTDPATGSIPTAFISAAMRDPVVAKALRDFFAARHRQSAPIVERAVARGELPEGTDAADVVRTAVAPLYYRLFISGEPVDETVADRAAATALAAARAGAFVTPA
ncbi:AcrR family transcriptional regulator [Streptosporangium becharense]|uniref:AcrR family transcriptional regulator n=1 Tax=Streptosporangium becharense TaxID=1816182 RepID=A0A7W9IHE0_9ACTN|nr:TetR/AcrR family transcriptional regulator [Streptosporangium becharense]MBB2912416.1 AcrR family transcriptional regulator [Streptosporangium becharense]MBB5820755.1 AcrR family transcriptional regulator [Streptosporangium becharense]